MFLKILENGKETGNGSTKGLPATAFNTRIYDAQKSVL
jgi:hypothetical protein